jgi:hypothetical protein
MKNRVRALLITVTASGAVVAAATMAAAGAKWT